MKNLKQIFHRMTLGLVCAALPMLGGCANTITWQEEVKLLDGRVITVTQKRRYEEGAPSEVWLTFKLPELGNQEIVWHENLEPLVLNIEAGNLYVVGLPHSSTQFRQYGSPKPYYIGFRYENSKWVRLPFNDIPVAIYDSNMWIEVAPESDSKYVSLTDKAKLMHSERYGQYLKKINPKPESLNY